jgi:hypothetical protein
MKKIGSTFFSPQRILCSHFYGIFFYREFYHLAKTSEEMQSNRASVANSWKICSAKTTKKIGRTDYHSIETFVQRILA